MGIENMEVSRGGSFMKIQHDMGTIGILRQKEIITRSFSKSTQRLSSGFRVNSSADDAAALNISEKMRWQIRGLNKANQNIQDGVSLVQVADGALSEVHDILQRMNELSVQAANDTNTDDDREALKQEVDQLAAEITRIGKSTSYNGLFIFDKMRPGDVDLTGVTDLVKCAAADTGYLTEAFKDSSGNWHAAAKLDFSNITSGNIAKLYDKYFSFTCSQSCPEAFTFTMINGDGTQSSATNLNGSVNHKYTLDIHGMTTGAQIVDALFKLVDDYPPSSATTHPDGSVNVSHSNVMIKTDPNTLVVHETNSRASEQAALNAFKNATGKYGAIDCSSIVKAEPEKDYNILDFQTGCLNTDNLSVTIDKMNASLLGVDKLDLSSYSSAGKAIDKVAKAIEEVSERRSRLGAEQNRFSSMINQNGSTSENTQSAESKLRDADYADETMAYSKSNTLIELSTTLIHDYSQRTRDVLMMFN